MLFFARQYSIFFPLKENSTFNLLLSLKSEYVTCRQASMVALKSADSKISLLKITMVSFFGFGKYVKDSGDVFRNVKVYVCNG